MIKGEISILLKHKGCQGAVSNDKSYERQLAILKVSQACWTVDRTLMVVRQACCQNIKGEWGWLVTTKVIKVDQKH